MGSYRSFSVDEEVCFGDRRSSQYFVKVIYIYICTKLPEEHSCKYKTPQRLLATPPELPIRPSLSILLVFI